MLTQAVALTISRAVRCGRELKARHCKVEDIAPREISTLAVLKKTEWCNCITAATGFKLFALPLDVSFFP